MAYSAIFLNTVKEVVAFVTQKPYDGQLVVFCSFLKGYGVKASILYQSYTWQSCREKHFYRSLQAELKALKQEGFTHVLLPPFTKSLSQEGYLPQALYSLNSQYGNQASLCQLIEAAHDLGIKVLGDAVLNHRVGVKSWGDLQNPDWDPTCICQDDEWPKAKGQPDSGAMVPYARDIDFSQKKVIDDLKKWLSWLTEKIGFDGFRLDFARGYAANYAKILMDHVPEKTFIAEIWHDFNVQNSDKNRQQLMDWLDATSANAYVFDFTTYGLLQHAFSHMDFSKLADKHGCPTGAIGWWPERSFTFGGNHDVSSNEFGGQSYWPMPKRYLTAYYAYLLTHPGKPCVYKGHYQHGKLKNEIKKLLEIRKDFQIDHAPWIEIHKATPTSYVACINKTLWIQLGENANDGKTGIILCSGDGYVIWT